MNYPKECFCINENITKQKRKEYEEETDKMYTDIINKYPDFNKMNLMERYKIIKEYKTKGGLF